MKSSHLLALFFILSAWQVNAQHQASMKFGQITPADFRQASNNVDTSAAAVILADIGSTRVVDNTKGDFGLEFKHFRRAQVLKKSGYDLADVSIMIYTDKDGEQELKNLRAVSYNLENGKIVQTKLDDKTSLFKDRIDKNRVIKKFTMPNVKEGTIIEYEYKISSDFIFFLYPWDFQGDYPRLWSEYTVMMPQFYDYVTLTQGYQPYYISDKKDRRETFNFTNADNFQRASFTCGVTDFRWVMKDVPAIRKENFTSTIDNHVSRIRFQLAGYKEPYVPKNIMETWPQACAGLLEREDFGSNLLRDNGWLHDIVKEATTGAKTELDKARGIYNYVRDKFTCTQYNSVFLKNSLKNIVKARKGTEADINLVLTAMLLKAGLSAAPVLLSTRDNGYAYTMYPMMDRFNYVISVVQAQGKEYLLDASRPRMAFGKLSYELYNGHARIVNDSATRIDLSADSLLEGKTTSVFVIGDEKGVLSGTFNQSPGFYESVALREKISVHGQSQFFQEIRSGYEGEIELTETGVDALQQFEEPLAIHYSFKMDPGENDILYFNPMMNEGLKENPFKSLRRFYPVEMNYAIDQTYLLRLETPPGYVIDELPKQLTLKLNAAGDGFFEYRLSESKGTISLRSRLRINRTFYSPEEYDWLREFFNLIVKKHAEQIVFKKK